MEEDIKVLEDFINKPVKSGKFNKISNKEIQALGNMLKRYKELQKENENYKKYAVIMSTEGLLINGVKFSFNDFIPISVIQNKKSNLDEEDLEIYDTDSEDLRIAKYEQRAVLDFCKEILEKGNK